ncbi:MAG: dihydrofolate reductase [Bifidobacteriaceae bacterium]|nr:dihydrofolate reductase [Bifidobacteriaceae bacterium]
MEKQIGLIWAEAYSQDGRPHAIGYRGKIPWHIPEDLKYFSKLTHGGTVIMGRKTWESLPDKYKPLPNRKNIVITSNPAQINNPQVLTVTSIKEAIARSNTEKIWLIGGATIYRAGLRYANTAYITRIRKKVAADTFAPQLRGFWKLQNTSDWMLSSTGEQFCFYKYTKKPPLFNLGKMASKVEDTYVKHNIAWLSRKRKVTFETYISYGNDKRVRILARAVLASSKRNPNELRRGFRTLAAAQVPNIAVCVAINGKELNQTFQTDRGGYIDQYIDLNLPSGHHKIQFWTPDNSQKKSLGYLVIIDKATRWGIISDIDDTIMVSKIPSILLGAYNSLFRSPNKRQAVYGMKRLFASLHNRFKQVAVFYVSTAPWNISQTVKNFLKANDFPYSPFILRDFGPTGEKLFITGREHKIQAIQQIFADFPDMQWILIGDDGQIDPSIYRDIADLYPEKIKSIIIRRLSGSELFLNHLIPVSFENPFTKRVNYKSIPVIAANDGYKLRQLVENILN